ncbi:chemotaxis protein [Enterobacterales bacterium CwR94]|nr:chemotaxis protein [Enterobacterales bacterium CwR94]
MTLWQKPVNTSNSMVYQREKAASITKAAEAFEGFLEVAPIKTASGIKKTNELKSVINKIQRSATTESIDEFKRLEHDFRGLIVKYDVQGTKESVAASYHSVIVIISATLLIFSTASLFLFFILRREFLSITQAIKHNIYLISQGDLLQDQKAHREDINGVHHELDGMRASLTKIAASIKHASAQVQSISSEITLGNQDLSARTEQQASALQETAASMEEIRTTVASNTENARQANGLAAKANDMAQSGSEVMASVITSMQKIEQSATHIAEISYVINGIAQQTNILALNAAVEAARAGESGRGFAVVATEVRHLAKRSADAAEEISELIQQSILNVNEGTQQVQDAGNAMHNIVESIARVSTIMREITQSSEEQSCGVNQVAVALNEMDTVTQRNALLVEKSSDIAEDMDTYAQQLAAAVSIFRIDPRLENTLVGEVVSR